MVARNSSVCLPRFSGCYSPFIFGSGNVNNVFVYGFVLGFVLYRELCCSVVVVKVRFVITRSVFQFGVRHKLVLCCVFGCELSYSVMVVSSCAVLWLRVRYSMWLWW